MLAGTSGSGRVYVPAHRGTERPPSGHHRAMKGKLNTPNAYMYACNVCLFTFCRILTGEGRSQPSFDSQPKAADRDPPGDR